MAVTFHSLLPLSESKDQIAERHSDSGILFPLSPTEDRLLQFDADLAERFSLLHDELESSNPVGADVLDRLTDVSVENLEHHHVAGSQAPAGSAVSKTARLRTERILRAILEVLHEVHTRLRENIALNANEVRSLFTARVENSLGVTDPLVMELASVQILETTDEEAAAEDAEADLQSAAFGEVDADRVAAPATQSDETPTRGGTAASGIHHGAGQLLFGISRTGREPVVNKAPTSKSFSASDRTEASDDSQHIE